MNTEPVPGFNELKDSLLAKLEEPINNLILCKMKLDQYRNSVHKNLAIEEQIKSQLNHEAEYIGKILTID